MKINNRFTLQHITFDAVRRTSENVLCILRAVSHDHSGDSKLDLTIFSGPVFGQEIVTSSDNLPAAFHSACSISKANFRLFLRMKFVHCF